MRNIKDLYTDYFIYGNTLSDQEVLRLKKHLTVIVDYCIALGNTFHNTAKEATLNLNDLNDICQTRKIIEDDIATNIVDCPPLLLEQYYLLIIQLLQLGDTVSDNNEILQRYVERLSEFYGVEEQLIQKIVLTDISSSNIKEKHKILMKLGDII